MHYRSNRAECIQAAHQQAYFQPDGIVLMGHGEKLKRVGK